MAAIRGLFPVLHVTIAAYLEHSEVFQMRSVAR